MLAIGATGVLGRDLVPLLLARGHELTVMAPGRRLDALPTEVRGWRASLLDDGVQQRLPSVLGTQDAVVNVATAIPRDPRKAGSWELNTRLRVEGTRRLVDAAVAAGLGRLVQMSITMAYPDGGESWLDESAPLDRDPRRAPLVAPVVAMEDAIRGLPADGPRWTILRAARFVGPDTVQDEHRRLLAVGRIAVAGDPAGFVSMVATQDFARAVADATESEDCAGSVLNVADAPVRRDAYLDGLARIDALEPPRRAPEQDPELPSQRVDSSRMRRLLGWRPVAGIWPAAPLS